MFKHELGKEAKSKVTGLIGVITSRSQCLYGYNRYYLQPKADKESKVPDGWWIDEDDVEIVGEGVIKAAKETGGPMSRTV